MAGNPREHVKDKGFWDGGTPGHAKNDQGAGRADGFPGSRKPNRVGVRTDIEFPKEDEEKKTSVYPRA
jgi:hypothetical protein